jgi:hypothetical protein
MPVKGAEIDPPLLIQPAKLDPSAARLLWVTLPHMFRDSIEVIHGSPSLKQVGRLSSFLRSLLRRHAMDVF